MNVKISKHNYQKKLTGILNVKISKHNYQKKLTGILNVKISDIETLKGYMTSEDEDIQPSFPSIFFHLTF